MKKAILHEEAYSLPTEICKKIENQDANAIINLMTNLEKDFEELQEQTIIEQAGIEARRKLGLPVEDTSSDIIFKLIEEAINEVLGNNGEQKIINHARDEALKKLNGT